MTYEQKMLTLIWFTFLAIWLVFTIRSIMASELKERKKFEAWLKRMNEK